MTDEQGSNGRYPANRGEQDRDFPISGQLAADDEISLFDLWEVLRRRRLTILVVFLAVVLGAGGYGIYKAPVYNFQTAIELGSYQTESGETIYLEAPGSLLSRIENLFIPEADRAMRAAGGRVPSADANSADSEELVYIESEAPESLVGPVSDLHQRIASSVSDDHDGRLESVREDRRTALREAENELAYLRSGSVRSDRLIEARAELNQSQQALDTLRADLDSERQELASELNNAERRMEAREAQSASIEAKIAGIERRQAQLESEIERLRPVNETLSDATTPESLPEDALAELLISTTQSLEVTRRLGDLERQLQVELPERRDELDNRLQSNRLRMENLDLEIERLNARLERFDASAQRQLSAANEAVSIADDALAARDTDYNREVELASEKVARAEQRLADPQPTQALFMAEQSVNTVGTSTSLLVALGAVLGLMLGVFAAFIGEFLANARAYREQSESDQT